MYLLLGHAADPCCAGVAARLEARGLTTRTVNDPLAPPAELVWRLERDGVTSRLSAGMPDSAIAGVLVRDTGWLDPDEWDKDDHAYMQAELRAITLAWLAGLSCPIINAPHPALWYRAGAPLTAWRPVLRAAGLPLPEVVITNDPAEAGAFRDRLARAGVNGAVYCPLTSPAGFVLSSDDAWTRLAAVQRRTPVCLTEPHGAALLACVVGHDVIWNDAAPPEARALEPALRRFASAARLTFVEIGVASVRGGPAVVFVDTRPRLERFNDETRDQILDALVAELTQARAASPLAPLVSS